MDTPHTNPAAGPFSPGTLPSPAPMTDIERLRLEAAAARNAALAAALRRAARAIFRFFATIGAALRAWPQRKATYDALRALSDRELRDIGLTRADIGRVFDPDFTPRPANEAGQKSTPRAA